MNVLVTNARHGSTLAIVRSLGKTENITAIDSCKINSTYFSRYNNRTNKRYTSPSYSIKQFILDMVKIVKDGGFDVLLPVGADTTMPISFFKDRLEPYVKVPVADYNILEKAHNKQKCLEIAKSIGIPIPKTIIPKDSEHLRDLSTNLEYPAVIKLRKSTSAKGLRYANTPSELIEAYNLPMPQSDIIMEYSRPMIQEYIPGDIYDVCTLFDKGRHITSLAQKRILTVPYSGGAGLVNITVEYPELIDMTIKLLEKLNWHGVAEVEYKLDSNDCPRLMEVNSKFWGTLGLSIAAGVNFPKLLCDMTMGKKIRPPEYKRDVKMMWICPGIVMHVKQSPHKLESIRDMLNHNRTGAMLNVSLRDPISSFVQVLHMLGGILI